MPRTTTKISDDNDPAEVSVINFDGNATVGSGNATVSVANTPKQLGSNACRRVTVQAFSSNTDYIAVGDTNIEVNSPTPRGIILPPLSTHTFTVENTNLIYVDASTVGAGITFIYEN